MTEDPLELRRLTSDDLGALRAFYDGLSPSVGATFEPFGHRPAEPVLAKYLAASDRAAHVSFGLFDPGGSLVGHAFVWNVDTEHPVFGIGLEERAQGRGWGRRMARRVLEEADARGAARVELTVLQANTRAWTLYESLGFRRTGTSSFRTENDSFRMERP